MPSRAGSPNKKTSAFQARLRAFMEEKGVDPHFAMVEMLADTSTRVELAKDGTAFEVPTVPIGIKFACAKELAQYLEPKLRSVELTGDPDQPLHVHILEQIAADAYNRQPPQPSDP